MVLFVCTKNRALGGSLDSALGKQWERSMLGRQHAAWFPWKPAWASSLVLIGVPKRITGSSAVPLFVAVNFNATQTNRLALFQLWPIRLNHREHGSQVKTENQPSTHLTCCSSVSAAQPHFYSIFRSSPRRAFWKCFVCCLDMTE